MKDFITSEERMGIIREIMTDKYNLDMHDKLKIMELEQECQDIFDSGVKYDIT